MIGLLSSSCIVAVTALQLPASAVFVAVRIILFDVPAMSETAFEAGVSPPELAPIVRASAVVPFK